MFDPASLFSPSQLSSLTSTSVEPSPQLTMLTRRRAQLECYVVPPRLSPSTMELYQQLPDYLGGDPEFVRNDLDAVVGEYPLDSQSKPSHYFVRFKDGLARRVSHSSLLPSLLFRSLTFLDIFAYIHRQSQRSRGRVSYVLQTFLLFYCFKSPTERRKAQGLLDHFDPASDDVHPHSRMNARMATSQTSSESDVSESPLTSDSPLTDEDDDKSGDDNFTGQASTRKSARLTAGKPKFMQSKLPFSPKKLRSNRAQRERAVYESGDDLGGYGQVDSDVEILAPRRSTRSRKSARTNLADDFVDGGESDGDSYQGSPRPESRGKAGKKFKKKWPATARPAYGHFRDISDLDFDHYEDEATSSLRAHRNICEKCHRRPAHKELAKVKKGRRKTNDEEGESDDNDEERIQSLGGWVRWFGYSKFCSYILLIQFYSLKCPVVAHWKCLARTQRDEITRAACSRDKEQCRAQAEEASEPSPGDLPDRKELDINQTTEFICGLCMKGGICMGCLEVALEPDPSVANKQHPYRASLEPSAQGDVPDIEMVDSTSHIRDDTFVQPSPELLFRCFSCRRLAHYQHLPNPENGAWEDVNLASYYQKETDWRCADCASYIYPLGKILAWRPYPPDVAEPTFANPPDVKASLPREYLVKWADRSYRRTQWVPHMWLVSTNLSKLKHFLTRGSKVRLLDEPVSDETAMDTHELDGIDKEPIFFEPGAEVTPEVSPSTEPKHITLGPLLDAERRIPPAWKTVDRVLDVRFWSPPSNTKGKHKKGASQVDGSHPSPAQQLERAYAEGEQPDESLMEEPGDWLSRARENLSFEHIDKVVWVFIKWEDLGYDEGWHPGLYVAIIIQFLDSNLGLSTSLRRAWVWCL